MLVQGGAGAVGYYAVQVAKLGGAARVIATVSRDEQAERRPTREVARFEPAFEKEADNDQRHREDAAVGEQVGDVVRPVGHRLVPQLLA